MKQPTKKQTSYYVKQLLLLDAYLRGVITKEEWLERGFPYLIPDMIELLTGENFSTSEKWRNFVRSNLSSKGKQK